MDAVDHWGVAREGGPKLSEASSRFDDLTVVIPAFNEAEGLGVTLEPLIAQLPGAQIIVVDDHSQDDTSRVASSFAGVRVIRHAFNRGQGASLKTGMRAATTPYVAWFDADNEHRTEDLVRLYRRAKDNDLVAVIGQRLSRSTSLTRGLGKGLIRLIGRPLKISAGSDLNCGLRIFRREVIARYLTLIPERFSASLVSTLVMLERGYPIAFEPIRTNVRVGTSTVGLKDGFEAILQLIRAVLLFAPLRLFLPLGLLGTVFGIAYSLGYALIRKQGIPVGGMFLMLAGILIMMLGLIADQLSQMRLCSLGERGEQAEDRNAGCAR